MGFVFVMLGLQGVKDLLTMSTDWVTVEQLNALNVTVTSVPAGTVVGLASTFTFTVSPGAQVMAAAGAMPTTSATGPARRTAVRSRLIILCIWHPRVPTPRNSCLWAEA